MTKVESHIALLIDADNAPASKIDTQAYVYELAESFPEKSIYITGNPYFMEELEYPDNVLLIPSINELILILED